MNPHEEFLELCAVSTSGELTQEERRKLDNHLLGCVACREALKQFQETVHTAVPGIAAEIPQNKMELDGRWAADKAEAALFERLSREENQITARKTSKGIIEGSEPSNHRAYFPSRFDWRQMWMSYAAAILLFLALAVSAYRVGIRKGSEITTNGTATDGKGDSLLEVQLSDLGHERETLRTQLAARDKEIAELKQQFNRLNAEGKERSAQNDTSLDQQKRQLTEQAASANAQLSDLQKQFEDEAKKRSEESSHAAALEAKLTELTDQLHRRGEAVAAQARQLENLKGVIDQEQTQLGDQKELLDHDRDIRELMGARDLYIAEVYDVAKNGATQKSYGRIFFTKGKSLIFYAYDLDHQPGSKMPGTFQAWGQHGTDREQALSLGVFYEDNASKKRWVLKFDDPQKLEQIDAVFVTAEPSGGSSKPSGKPFLFAYLKVNPNHP